MKVSSRGESRLGPRRRSPSAIATNVASKGSTSIRSGGTGLSEGNGEEGRPLGCLGAGGLSARLGVSVCSCSMETIARSGLDSSCSASFKSNTYPFVRNQRTAAASTDTVTEPTIRIHLFVPGVRTALSASSTPTPTTTRPSLLLCIQFRTSLLTSWLLGTIRDALSKV